MNKELETEKDPFENLRQIAIQKIYEVLNLEPDVLYIEKNKSSLTFTLSIDPLEGQINYTETKKILEKFSLMFTTAFAEATGVTATVSETLDLAEEMAVFIVDVNPANSVGQSYIADFETRLATSNINDVREKVEVLLGIYGKALTVIHVIDPFGVLIIVENAALDTTTFKSIEKMMHDYPTVRFTDRSEKTSIIFQVSERIQVAPLAASWDERTLSETMLSALSVIENYLLEADITYDSRRKGSAFEFIIEELDDSAKLLALAKQQSGITATYDSESNTLSLKPRLN